MVRKIAILMLAAAVFTAGEVFADFLWWTTYAPSEIEVETIDGEGTVTAEELGVTDARIKVSGGSAGEGAYLPLAYIVEDDDGNQAVLIGTPPGGTVQYVDSDYGAGEVFASLGSYAASEYSFQVELGHWDESGEVWTALALSGFARFDDLYYMGRLNPGENYITRDPLETPGSLPWNPTDYTAVVPIPEPSCAFLIAIGCMVIVLKRRTAA